MHSEVAGLATVTKNYGSRRALDGIDLGVGRGEILALLGPNGAGKTTAVKLLLGLLDPDAGTVRLTGPQGSGILRSMSLANCLIDLPAGPSRIEKGELVEVILTEQPEPR